MAWTEKYIDLDFTKTGSAVSKNGSGSDGAWARGDPTSVFTPTTAPDWTADVLIGRTLTTSEGTFTVTDNDATTVTVTNIDATPTNGAYVGTWRIGVGSTADPWASYGGAMLALAATMTAPTKVYVRGNQTLSANLAFDRAGTVAYPLKWIGCTGSGATWTRIGNDGSTAKPLLTCSTYDVDQTGAYNIFEGLGFTYANVAAHGTFDVSATGSLFARCRFTNTADNANGTAIYVSGSYIRILSCYCESHVASNYCVALTVTSMIALCVVKGGTIGIRQSGANGVTLFNTVRGCAGDGIQHTGNQACVAFNTLYGCAGDGIDVAGTTNFVFGNLCVGSGTMDYPINQSSGTDSLSLVAFNMWHNVGTDKINGLTEVGAAEYDDGSAFWNYGLVAGATGPLPDAATNDFSIASALRNLAFGDYENDTGYANYLDHGAVQHADPVLPTAAQTVYTGTASYGYADALYDGNFYAPNSGDAPYTEDTDAVLAGWFYGVGNATEGTGTGGYPYGDASQEKVLTTAAGAGTFSVANLTNAKILKNTTWGVSLGETGTLEGCVDDTGTNQGTTGLLVAGTFYATGWWDGLTYEATPDFPAVTSVLTTDTVDGAAGTFDATNLSVGNVIQGVTFGVGLTGTGANLLATHTTYLSLEAGRNSTTAAAGQILTTYSVTIAGSTTNGTYVPIAQADARKTGAGYYGAGGAVDGTCYVPASTNVRKDIPVDDEVGSLVGIIDSDGTYHAYGTCSIAQAWTEIGIVHGVGAVNATGVLSAAGTYSSLAYATEAAGGTYHEAAVGEVKNLVAFGAASALTGTYSPGGTFTEGQAAQLATDQAAAGLVAGSILTTVVELLGTVNGTYVAPVQAGYSALAAGYGDGGLTTGTLAASKIHDATYGTLADGSVLVAAGGTYIDPSDADVRKTIAVGVSPRAGTLVGVVDSTGTQHDYGTCSSTQAWDVDGIIHTSGTAATSGILTSGGGYYAAGILADANTYYTYGTFSLTGAYNATGVIYGTGSYATEASRNTDPGIANVKDGVAYEILGAALEGTYEGTVGTYPAAAYVHSNAGDYGPTGVEYTPSLSVLANWCLIAGITWPALDEVDGGVAFGPVTGLEYVGTGVNAATIRTALGLASANLDTQLGAIPTVGEIDTQLSSTHGAGTWGSSGAGTGARTVTFTVTASAVALQGARVRLYRTGSSDRTGDTNASGQVVLYCDVDATWSYVVTHPLYDSESGSVVVDDNEAVAVSMDAVAVTAATDPDQTTAYWYVYGNDGALVGSADVTATIEIIDVPDDRGYAYDDTALSLSTTAGGLMSALLFKGAKYKVTLSDNREWTVEVPRNAGTTYRLPPIRVVK